MGVLVAGRRFASLGGTTWRRPTRHRHSTYLLYSQLVHRENIAMIFKKLFTVAAASALSLGCLTIGPNASAADHQEAPMVARGSGNGALDLNDLYAFQSPSNPNNVVMILTVNPFAGVDSPTTFSTRGVLEFAVDTSTPLDAIPDFSYRFYFSPARNGSQRFVCVQQNGRVLVSGETGKTTMIRGGGMVTAGLFDDPFFFDVAGFRNGFMFTGANGFAPANVSAIVLELPRTTFPTNNIAIVTRSLNGARQLDRTGRPAIATALIAPGARRNDFNFARPDQDVQLFRTEVVNRIQQLNGGNVAHANSTADLLLPDVMTIDTSNPAGFLNGRQLADDVIDGALGVLTNGGVTTDLAPNDSLFTTTFPYLGPATVIPAAQ